MKRKFVKKGHQQTGFSDEKLAAAYCILRDLSDDEFESWVERDDVSPSKYERGLNEFMSQPISEKIAGLKLRADKTNKPSLLEKIQSKLKEFFVFTDLPQFERAGSEVFCSETTPDKSEQRILNLLDKYDEAELNEKLPWAAHRVIVMKVPVEKSSEVYYRALIEQREGETAKTGSLKIVLHAGEHTDKVKLEFDFPNRTFPKSVPVNAPVSFEPILE